MFPSFAPGAQFLGPVPAGPMRKPFVDQTCPPLLPETMTMQCAKCVKPLPPTENGGIRPYPPAPPTATPQALKENSTATGRRSRAGERSKEKRMEEKKSRTTLERYMPEKRPTPNTPTGDKGNRQRSSLVHAVLVGALRGHGWGRDARRRGDVVHVADEGLRVESEGFTHETCDSVERVSIWQQTGWKSGALTPTRPPHREWSSTAARRRS